MHVHAWCNIRALGLCYYSVSDCGSLNDPLNGALELNETTFGSIAEYRCNEGFTVMGNVSERTCQANGRWTEEPICIGEYQNKD